MAESYFKDPLLAKWEQTACSETKALLGEGERDPLDACFVLMKAVRFASLERRDLARADADRLRTIILAELSGAQRARERARAMFEGNAESAQRYSKSHRGQAAAHARDVAKYILEAFDGE